MREELRISLNLFVVALAAAWRRLWRGPQVIAITGSVGKTTAKKCLAAILSTHFPITVSDTANRGTRFELPRTLLRTRRRHRFVVAEVGILKPGIMWRSAWLLKPDIAVILGVRWQHSANFQSLDHIAAEKAKLLGGLRRGGLAVLNGEDPRVAAMANPARFRVSLFGTSPDSELWATGVAASWPGRLEFQVHTTEATLRVETHLVGRHWVPSVLAALAVARKCGVSLEDSIRALRDMEPTVARLEPCRLPSGATMLRDEYNGAMDTLLRALTVLEESSGVKRRVVVVGNTSDAAQTGPELAERVGREIARVSEMAVFIGEHAEESARAAVDAGMDPRHAHSLRYAEEVPSLLQRELQAGDLVLLKGMFSDHLSRLYFAQLGTVACWKKVCPKMTLCDDCPELGFRAGSRGLPGATGS